MSCTSHAAALAQLGVDATAGPADVGAATSGDTSGSAIPMRSVALACDALNEICHSRAAVEEVVTAPVRQYNIQLAICAEHATCACQQPLALQHIPT